MQDYTGVAQCALHHRTYHLLHLVQPCAYILRLPDRLITQQFVLCYLYFVSYYIHRFILYT